MQARPVRSAPMPPPGAPVFRATVHGLPFADRARHLERVRPREELWLVPDPPGSAQDQVWVHLEGGDTVGHLPYEIGRWLAPWMRSGGSARARVLRVGDATVPSWKRLLLEVTCG